MRYVPLGMVTRPFGVKGEVRVRPYNPRTTWFEKARGIWLRDGPDQGPEYYPFVNQRRHKEFIVLSLKDVRDRDRAEELRGKEVVAPEEELEPLEEGEYYWYQMIGLSVETVEKKRLGEVERMEETFPEAGGNDVFVVRTDKGELLLPATEETVAEVDLENSKLIVNLVPGLIDIKG